MICCIIIILLYNEEKTSPERIFTNKMVTVWNQRCQTWIIILQRSLSLSNTVGNKMFSLYNFQSDVFLKDYFVQSFMHECQHTLMYLLFCFILFVILADYVARYSCLQHYQLVQIFLSFPPNVAIKWIIWFKEKTCCP